MANVSDTSELTTPSPHIPVLTQANVSPASGPVSLLQDPFLSKVMALCKELFGSVATVEPMLDPTEPTDSWLCFNVAATGSHADLLKRELQWHEKVEQLTGNRTGRYRLSIYPVE